MVEIFAGRAEEVENVAALIDQDDSGIEVLEKRLLIQLYRTA